MIYYELKKYDESLNDFDKSNKLGYAKYDLYYFIGEILEIKTNYKEAIKYYDEALKSAEEYNGQKDYTYYYIVGMILYKLSKFEKAINNFYKSLSFIFEDKSYIETLLMYCDNILELENDNKVFYAYKILFLIMLNKYDDALYLYNELYTTNEVLDSNKLYSKVLEILNHNNIELKNENSLTEYIEQNNSDIKYYDDLIKKYPDNINGYIGKANIYKQLADINSSKKYYNLSLECYDIIINKDNKNIEAYIGKADIYKHLAYLNNSSKKYYNLAIECYNKIIDIDKNNIDI